MSDVNMRERAERGAALLDTVRPYWYESISIGALDISDCRTCVLGQVYGDYAAGLKELFPDASSFRSTASDGDELSANTTSDYYGYSMFDVSMMRGHWEKLTQAWRDIIAERRCRVLDLDLIGHVNEKVNISV